VNPKENRHFKRKEKEGQAFQTTDREPIDPATGGFARRVSSRVRSPSFRSRQLRRPRPGEPKSSRRFRLLLTNPQPFRTTLGSFRKNSRIAPGRPSGSCSDDIKPPPAAVRTGRLDALIPCAYSIAVELPVISGGLLVRCRTMASRVYQVVINPRPNDG
jgi:hypothetical protein